MDNIALHHQVFIKLGMARVIGVNTTHPGSSKIHLVNLFRLEKLSLSTLAGQIPLTATAGNRTVPASPSNYCTTAELIMPG